MVRKMHPSTYQVKVSYSGNDFQSFFAKFPDSRGNSAFVKLQQKMVSRKDAKNAKNAKEKPVLLNKP